MGWADRVGTLQAGPLRRPDRGRERSADRHQRARARAVRDEGRHRPPAEVTARVPCGHLAATVHARRSRPTIATTGPPDTNAMRAAGTPPVSRLATGARLSASINLDASLRQRFVVDIAQRDEAAIRRPRQRGDHPGRLQGQLAHRLEGRRIAQRQATVHAARCQRPVARAEPQREEREVAVDEPDLAPGCRIPDAKVRLGAGTRHDRRARPNGQVLQLGPVTAELLPQARRTRCRTPGSRRTPRRSRASSRRRRTRPPASAPLRGRPAASSAGHPARFACGPATRRWQRSTPRDRRPSSRRQARAPSCGFNTTVGAVSRPFHIATWPSASPAATGRRLVDRGQARDVGGQGDGRGGQRRGRQAPGPAERRADRQDSRRRRATRTPCVRVIGLTPSRAPARIRPTPSPRPAAR